MNLKEKAKKLPLSPGVYRWLDGKGKILYIGRATNLRHRVLQYFRPDMELRIGEMVSLAKNIKYNKTDSVLEAIILEANLIKKFWPKYNVKDKDDRSFAYVVIAKSDWPKPIIVRGKDLGKYSPGRAHIFGPYLNATLIKNALRIIRRLFPYSTCQPGSGQPCFDYQIGLCPGACVSAITPQEYKKNIRNIIWLFEGKKKQLVKKLAKENPELSGAFRHISDASLISRDEISGNGGVGRIEAYDVSHLSGKETVGAMAVFIGDQPDKSQYRLFNIKTVTNNDVQALEEMISRRLNHPEWPLPDLFLVDGGRPQINQISKLFKKLKVVKPLLGLSKFGGDKLVYSAGTPKNVRELAVNMLITLKQARDEAHRFGNSARQKKMRIR
ncbi:MAG: GIY-YIG nuclease family protein [Patescibacteria group bacterium]